MKSSSSTPTSKLRSNHISFAPATVTETDIAPDFVIDIESYSAGDDYYLIVDDTLVDITDPTAEQITAQQMVLTDLSLSTYDARADGKFEIAVRVVHSDGSEFISEDVSYLYQH